MQRTRKTSDGFEMPLEMMSSMKENIRLCFCYLSLKSSCEKERFFFIESMSQLLNQNAKSVCLCVLQACFIAVDWREEDEWELLKMSFLC
jgi:hypothetical protein